MAETLRVLLAGSTRASVLVSRATLLFDAYSVLMLYAGSCSAEVYGETIRPSMMAADSAFSGTWARDYEPIHPLLREIRLTYHPNTLVPLSTALKLNNIVHGAVAKYLVPIGQSLLREHSDDHLAPPTEAQRQVSDRFFGVERIAICREEFLAQFVTKLGQVRSDLVHRPLPVSCGWPGLSAQQTGVVALFHRESAVVLSRLEESLE
ncbi:hypothetical protein AB0L97_35905 [Nocardia sp. NPDC051911]|uniref:hypothetical protein n=1 Tax=unclassified Nocardia TaxID=2637762 RepID=UPI00343F6EF7